MIHKAVYVCQQPFVNPRAGIVNKGASIACDDQRGPERETPSGGGGDCYVWLLSTSSSDPLCGLLDPHPGPEAEQLSERKTQT
jgi:hypothetical protein